MRIQLSRAEYQQTLDGTPVLSFQSLRLSLTTYINHKPIIPTSELKWVFTRTFNGQHKDDDQWNVDKIRQMVTHPGINPVKQGLTSVNRREPVFPFGASRTRLRVRAVSFGPTNYELCLHLSEWVINLHIGVPARNPFLRFAYPRV